MRESSLKPHLELGNYLHLTEGKTEARRVLDLYKVTWPAEAELKFKPCNLEFDAASVQRRGVLTPASPLLKGTLGHLGHCQALAQPRHLELLKDPSPEALKCFQTVSRTQRPGPSTLESETQGLFG